MATRSAALVLVVALLAACSLNGGNGDDDYGGFDSVTADATGRFRVERIDGVWWFVDPDGHGFFSSGVNSVNPAGDFALTLGRSPYLEEILERYGSEENWADATRNRLRSWGINTLGAFSIPTVFAEPMPYTVALQFSPLAPALTGIPGSAAATRDFLGPWFEIAARSYAEQASVCAHDPWCIGVFTDNEPVWARTPTQPIPFIYSYTALPAGASAKVELQEFLARRYENDVARFNEVWATQLASFDDFQNLAALPGNPAAESEAQLADDHAVRNYVAKQYFKVTHDALRSVSKDLLILGPRFATNNTPADLYEVAGPYVDVMSLNNYEIAPAARDVTFDPDLVLFSDNPWNDLDTVEQLSDKPLLISEFGYRAIVPGGPQGTIPPGFPRLADQTSRVERYRAYMKEVYARPYIVGAHWFQYMDQPAAGRSDGQNSNWGLVDIDDQPWHELVDAVAAENRMLPKARLDSR
jgi:hypothetical protein